MLSLPCRLLLRGGGHPLSWTNIGFSLNPPLSPTRKLYHNPEQRFSTRTLLPPCFYLPITLIRPVPLADSLLFHALLLPLVGNFFFLGGRGVKLAQRSTRQLIPRDQLLLPVKMANRLYPLPAAEDRATWPPAGKISGVGRKILDLGELSFYVKTHPDVIAKLTSPSIPYSSIYYRESIFRERSPRFFQSNLRVKPNLHTLTSI